MTKTKRELFTEVLELAKENGRKDLEKFVLHELELIDKRNEKDRERLAAKKAEDPLLDGIKSVLTNEYQTLTDIVAKLNYIEDVTAAKVSARLAKLDGEVERGDVKVATRKVKGYKLSNKEE